MQEVTCRQRANSKMKKRRKQRKEERKESYWTTKKESTMALAVGAGDGSEEA